MQKKIKNCILQILQKGAKRYENFPLSKIFLLPQKNWEAFVKRSPTKKPKLPAPSLIRMIPSAFALQTTPLPILASEKTATNLPSFLTRKTEEPCFEETLKNNLINNYCRSSAYEAARFVYLPEMKLLFEKLSKAMPDTIPDFTEEKKQVFSEFLSTPLSEMKPKKEDFSEVCKAALSQFFCNEGNGRMK